MEPSKFKKIHPYSNLPKNLPSFFQKYGEIVEEICMTDSFRLQFELIGQHCPNLQSIIINDESLISENIAGFKSIILGLKNLKSLELYIDYNEVSVSEVVDVLKESVSLKILALDIWNCEQNIVDLAGLHKLVHLENLKIKVGNMVKINDILTDLRMLRRLEIISGRIISNDQKNAFGLSELEKLEIAHCFIAACFPDCQKLRSLYIRRTKFTSDFGEWLSMKFKTLESLRTDDSLFAQSVLSKIFSSPHSEWVLPALKDLVIYEVSAPLTFPLPYCPMLTYLNMGRIDEYPFQKECFDWISKHTATINSLELPGLIFGKDCQDLPFFPKLRSFLLNSSFGLSPDRFFNWISKYATTMEILNIYGDLDRDRLLKLLSDCKNIRSFGVGRIFEKFSESFFKSLFNILKENGVTPDDPFKFRLSPLAMCRTKLYSLPGFELCKIQIDDNIGSKYQIKISKNSWNIF